MQNVNFVQDFWAMSWGKLVLGSNSFTAGDQSTCRSIQQFLSLRRTSWTSFLCLFLCLTVVPLRRTSFLCLFLCLTVVPLRRTSWTQRNRSPVPTCLLRQRTEPSLTQRSSNKFFRFLERTQGFQTYQPMSLFSLKKPGSETPILRYMKLNTFYLLMIFGYSRSLP